MEQLNSESQPEGENNDPADNLNANEGEEDIEDEDEEEEDDDDEDKMFDGEDAEFNDTIEDQGILIGEDLLVEEFKADDIVDKE